MRRALLSLSLLALVAAPIAARAASLDEITFTSTEAGDTGDIYTVIVPTTNVVLAADTDGSSYFNLYNIPVTAPYGSATEEVTFYGPTVSGGGFMDSTLAPSVVFYGTSLYSSLTGGPTTYTADFSIGSGTISGYDLAGNTPVTFDYTISSYTAPPVPGPAPEPSSLILLGTGAIGVLGTFRRRLFA